MGALLPDGFAELEQFVSTWDLPGTNARYAKRLASNIDVMKEFFEAMLARVEDIKAHLDAKSFAEYSPEDRRLARLMFAVGVVGPAVEIFKQPEVPDTAASGFDVIQESEL
jgi:hypothetical protein